MVVRFAVVGVLANNILLADRIVGGDANNGGIK